MVWILIALLLAGLFPAWAEAQAVAPESKWTFELFGGSYATESASGGGSPGSLPAGATFALASGRPSRAVSSWYFGDGAVLLNQVLTQFAGSTGTSFPRLSPIESVFQTSQPLRRNGGGAFGARLGRELTSRIAIEVSVERSLTSLDLDEATRAGLKTTSDTFNESFRALLNTSPVTNLAVSSTLDAPTVSNSQTRMAATLRWSIVNGRRFELHLLGGGGIARNSGDSSAATLTGKYSFRYFGTAPMEETDSVTVRIAQPKQGAIGVVGGGAIYNFSARSALRVDFRLQSNSNKVEAILSAAPRVAALTPADVLSTAAAISPGLQFSTQAGVRSSLSGPNANVTVFTGSGRSTQASVTVGLVRRF